MYGHFEGVTAKSYTSLCCACFEAGSNASSIVDMLGSKTLDLEYTM